MTDGDLANGRGGVMRRVDGPAPRWTPVYEWPATGETDLGKNLRGLTAIPDPAGSGEEVLVGPSKTCGRS